jgi:di/tricarboxylate transporter
VTWEAAVTALVVTLMFGALVRNLVPPDIALPAGAVVLTSLNAVSPRFPSAAQFAAAFGNEGLLTVGVLFVVAAGLTETGGLSLITERFLGRPRSVRSAQLRLMAPVAAASSVLNNTPVVAMFLPVVEEWSRRNRLSVSKLLIPKLLIPLSYAAIFGGCLTLIGTSTNLVVQSLMIQARKTDPGMPVMGMFTIGAIGLPAAVVGIAYVLLVSGRLLPERRSPRTELADAREYSVEMMVVPGSAIDGVSIEEAGLRHLPGVFLAAIERDGETLAAVGPEHVLRGDDRLMFVGVVDSVVDLQRLRGLAPATDQVFKLDSPRHDRCLVEAVVSPTSPLAGKGIREGRFRSRYDAVVIAVHRNGERIRAKIGDIVLQPGDTLLLEAHPRFLKAHRNNRDFLLMSALDDSSPRRYERTWVALLILGGLVALAGLESVFGLSLLNLAFVAGGLMVATRCCSIEQARRSVDWSLLLTIGAALTVGGAIQTTGLAGVVADGMLGVVDTAGPWVVLAQVYLLTLLFTELVTNNAAAALAFPIAHAAAARLGVNVMPFALAVAMAASAGFATPLGYQTHMMVYGPGGYRFSDFVRIGLPLDLVIAAVAVGLLPVVFPF